MTIEPKLIKTLRDKREKITKHIKPEKLDAMHAKGMLSARERIDTLFEEGTFQELGVQRVGQRFALVAAVGELATQLGILPWVVGAGSKADGISRR